MRAYSNPRLFEISTDKVDAEIPSPGAGVLLEIKVKEGETVPVNSVVAVIGAAGERVQGPQGPQGPQSPRVPQAPAMAASAAPIAPAAPAAPAGPATLADLPVIFHFSSSGTPAKFSSMTPRELGQSDSRWGKSLAHRTLSTPISWRAIRTPAGFRLNPQ